MRLPRKFNRTLPTQEVESPVSAARGALAPYQAAGDVLTAARNITTQKIELDREIETAEDRLYEQNEQTRLRTAVTEWENDPKYEMDVQEDGTPTPVRMREDFEAIKAEAMTRSEGFQNPVTRERYVSALDESLSLVDADVENVITQRRLGILKKGMMAGAEAAAASGDYERAREIINDAASRFQDVADKKGELFEGVDQLRIESEADRIAKLGYDAYQLDWQDGEEFRRALMESDREEAVKDAAIAKLSPIRSEWNKAYQQERQEQETLAIRYYGSDSRAIATGELTSIEELEARRDSGRYGEGAAREQRFNQLANMLVQGQRRGAALADITATINAGKFIQDTAANRKALDEYIETNTRGMEPQERAAFMVDTFRAAGTVSENFKHHLNTASKSQAALERWLPVYMELTQDESTMPNMHLSSAAEMQMEYGSQLIQSGHSAAEAAEMAWQRSKLDQATIDARQFEWKDDIQDRADKDHREFEDSDYFEKPGWGDSETRTEMRFEYLTNYKAAWDLYGDEATAKTYADRITKRTWVRSNLNGDYEITKFGIPGDTTGLRQNIIGQLSGNFRVPGEEGYQTRPVEDEEVELRVMDVQGNNWVIVPHTGGIPMLNEENRVPELVVSADEVAALNRSTLADNRNKERIQEIDERINEINNQILVRSNIDEATRERFRERIKKLTNEREALSGG